MTRRILIVQPSRTLAALIRLNLGHEGLALHVVADARAALDDAVAETPALIVADQDLQDATGLDLVEALRRTPALEAVPVLLTAPDYAVATLSGHLTDERVELLARPFERHALLERAWALLGREPGPAAAPSAQTEAPRAAEPEAPVMPPVSLEAESQPEAAMGAVLEDLDDRIEAAVARQVKSRLTDLVTAQLPGLVEEIVRARLAGLVEAALERDLKAKVDVAVEARQGAAADAALNERVPELVRERIEEVVWKAVPELAEGLIRDEINRLLDEEEPAP